MGFEDIVEQILSSRTDLTRQEVLRMIEEKKSSAEGFFTEETVARMVASDLAVQIPTDPLQPRLEIKNLISGLNDVTVTGRIIIVRASRTFTRSDMTEGRVARLFIADRSETLSVVLWDEQANIVDNGQIKPGQIIKFSHGYVRKGWDGRLELHMGAQGDVQVSPPDADETAYPALADFLKEIGEIAKEDRRTSTTGIVKRLYPASAFERKDGTEGKVRRLQLEDETGRIMAVFWNQKVDELGDVQREDCLRIMGARVKEGLNGQLELHVEDRTQIEILTE
jgi:replication factor A1